MKKYITIGLLSLLYIFTSCEDFLSERPSKSSSVVPSSIADLESVLAGMWRNDHISPHLIFASGDIDLNAELERRVPGSYSVQNVQAATWEREFSNTYTDYMWMYRYQNIFRSNMALFYLDQIEGTESEKAMIRSKAAFRRAFSYMELLNVYTLPYSEKNLEEPGLVLTTSIGFDYSLKRASLRETYDFVEKDLMEALKIEVKLENKYGQGSVNRVTNAAAKALTSRFYLMKHDYKTASEYALAAMADYGQDNIMDYNAIGYSDRIDRGTITIDGKDIDYEVKYPNTEFGYDYVENWTEDYFLGTAGSGFSYGFTTSLIVSPTYTSVFDSDGGKEQDARWKYFFVRNYGYLNNKPIDCVYYMKQRNYTLSVPEMLLTVAEYEAREGDFNKAISLVNDLRTKRIDPNGKVSLSAADRDEAIAIVLRERRREMGPLKGLFDIRRYNSNNYPLDDVTISREFFEYTPAGVNVSSPLRKYELRPDDRRIAFMIPEGDILAGKGELLQNTY